MANDIIDINVYETTETVAITVNPNLTTVNINKVTSTGGGSQNLQQVTDIGATTTNPIVVSTSTTAITASGVIGVSAEADETAIIGNGYFYGVIGEANFFDEFGDGAAIEGRSNSSVAGSFIAGATADGIIIESGTTSTGIPFKVSKNSVTKASINQAGELTATKLIKSGGTSSQFLMADGTTSTGSVGTTNLTTSQTSTNFTINSDTGTDASVPLGNGTLAGATLNDYTTTEKNKLAAISGTNTGDNAVNSLYSGLAASKQDNITLTTTGSSGAATLVGSTLNIPQYSGGGGGTLSNSIASGTDTYTATISGVASYVDGAAYLIRFTNGNTSTATLNINSLGARTLYRNNDGVLIGGDIQSGGEMVCVYSSALSAFKCIGTSPNDIVSYVTNADSVTITKGQPVYAFGGIGDRMTVKLAYNTLDATSAQTIGLVMSASIAAGQKGLVITQGLLDGLSTLPTSTFADGDTIYLGATAGTITNVKPYAPNHLVYLGVVTTASAGAAGRMYVKPQNGYELDEIHNVQAQNPTLKDTLWYDNTVSPAQWKTASIPTILGYTPVQSNTAITGATNTKITYDSKGLVTSGSSLIASDIPNIAQSQVTSLTTDLGLKANLASPTFTGTPTLPTGTIATTQTAGDSSTKLATTAFVTTADNLKQDKSLSANTIIANNTASTANGTEQVYKDIAEATNLSSVSTITWTGTTAPTSPISLNYKWSQIGSLVIARFNLVYTTAGSTITQLTITLPSTMPTPLSPTGFTAASDVLYYANGNFAGTKAIAGAMPTSSVLRRNAANNGYELVIVRTAAAVNTAQLAIQYFT